MAEAGWGSKNAHGNQKPELLYWDNNQILTAQANRKVNTMIFRYELYI